MFALGVLHRHGMVFLSCQTAAELSHAVFDCRATPRIHDHDGPAAFMLKDEPFKDINISFDLGALQTCPLFTLRKIGARTVRAAPVEVVGWIVSIADLSGHRCDAL